MRPAPGLTIEQQGDRILHRMLLCGEARGENDALDRLDSKSMLGVAFVPVNRLGRGRWRKLTLGQAILQPWQFSCFNPNDANRAKLLDLWKSEPVAWERANVVCDLLEEGLVLDPTKGATHYVRIEMWGREPANPARPQWYEGPSIEAGITKETARIGSHVFAVTP